MTGCVRKQKLRINVFSLLMGDTVFPYLGAESTLVASKEYCCPIFPLDAPQFSGALEAYCRAPTRLELWHPALLVTLASGTYQIGPIPEVRSLLPLLMPPVMKHRALPAML